MLLNEFLKEHQKGEEQQATIAQFTSAMAAVNKRLEQQAAKIDKVNAKVELARYRAADGGQQVENPLP
jgi:hypothetical protein